MPKSQVWYGEVVYALCLVSAILCTVGPLIVMMWPGQNILDPYQVLAAIWSGQPAGEIWGNYAGGFPGGHFYVSRLPEGDAIIQLGIAIGCSCALPGLLAASICYLREKPVAWLWAAMSLWVVFMIGFSAVFGGSPGH